MDIILNNYSLDGQYHSVDEFMDNLSNDILPILKSAKEHGGIINKNMEFFRANITKEKCLNDLLHIKTGSINYTELTLLKRYLVEMIDEPYWEENMMTDSKAEYSCDYTKDIPNCFTETYERKGVLLSFAHEKFLIESLSILKNKNRFFIDNCTNYENFCKVLFNKRKIGFADLLLGYHYERKIEFYKKDDMNELYEKGTLTKEDVINIVNDLKRMISNITNHISSRLSKNFTYKKESYYEFRTSISDGRELRIYYIQIEQTIVFLFPYIKKQQEIPYVILNKIAEVTKQYKIDKKIK